MQYIELNLATNEAVIKSVDGELAEGNVGSVELHIINTPNDWKSGSVWATFSKGSNQISHLSALVDSKYVTDVPAEMFKDDRNFGVFVWCIIGESYVETRRVARVSLAETGTITATTEIISKEEATEVMQCIQRMNTLYKIVDTAEKDRYQKYGTAEADRYDKYYKAEGLSKEEIASDDFESREMKFLRKESERQTAYGEAEKKRDDDYSGAESSRNNRYSSAEAERNRRYVLAEAERKNQFDSAESERNSAESVRQTNEESRQSFEEQRRSAESNRNSAETVRQSNESERQEAETQRQSEWGNGGTKEQTLLENFLSAIYNSTVPVPRADADNQGNKFQDTYTPLSEFRKILNGDTIVPKAMCDEYGRNFNQYYAPAEDLQKLIEGVYTVAKANADAQGNVIHETYAKKTDIVTSYNDLTDKPFSNVNWLDIDSLYGREKDGIYKVSGKEMSGIVGMGNSSSYMLVMTNVSGNVLQTCQYLIHSDGKSQYRLGTGTGIEDWSEWESVGTTSYNDLTDKPNLSAVATSGSYKDLSDKPITVLNEMMTLEGLDNLSAGIYIYPAAYGESQPEPVIVISGTLYNEEVLEDGTRLYYFRQTIIRAGSLTIREKVECNSRPDLQHDWEEVPLNDSLATKAYVDSAIGDALEGVY